MKKKCLALLLAVVLAVSLLPGTVFAAATSTQQRAYEAMIALKSQYPEGMKWNNDDYYGWKGGIYSGGYGCAGFAFLLSDAAFGSLPARMLTEFAFSDVRVGDILRINNNTHSVIVLEVRGSGVVIAEGNYNNSIHWGRTLTEAQVLAADYMMTRYPLAEEDTPTVPDTFTGSCGANLTWSYSGGTLTILGTGRMNDYAYPEFYEGAFDPVPWEAYRTQIHTIVIHDGVTGIGAYAFWEHSSLTGVTIPASVTAIGDQAFCRCSSLKDIYYGGSESQWKQIDIDFFEFGNEPLTRANIHCAVADPESPKITFSDVPADEWYAAPAAWAVGRGLVVGYPGGTFQPFNTTSRVMIITMLARLDNVVIAGDHWIGDAVNWAISKGVSDGSNPEDAISREEMITLLWKYEGRPDASRSELNRFSDCSSISNSAMDAMAWAVEQGFVIGNGDGTLNPLGTTNRAEATTLFMRYCDAMGK